MGKLKERLVMQYLLLVLAGVLLAGVTTFWATGRTFEEYVRNQQVIRAGSLVPALTQFYRLNGGWDGVKDILDTSTIGNMPRGMGRWGVGGHRGQLELSERVVLYDDRGQVVYDSLPSGGPVPQVIRESAVQINLDGINVGSVLVTSTAPGGGTVGHLEERYLANVRNALMVSGLASLVIAVILALRLAGQISKPIEVLRDASRMVAGGRYGYLAEVEVSRSPEELRELVWGFNSMSKELEVSEERKKEMLRDIAHEIKTPLTILSGNLEAASIGALELDHETIVGMLEEVSRLDGLVTNLNMLHEANSDTALESRSDDSTIREVSVSALANRAATAIRGLAQSRNIQVDVLVDPGASTVLADAQKVQQVFGNLLSNALRYTPEGGRIRISAAACDDTPDGGTSAKLPCVRFSVEDSGPGIAPSDLTRVFERFFRGDRSRSRATGGSGLGLSIARELVESMGGRIWAENATSCGAVFHFVLPAGELGRSR